MLCSNLIKSPEFLLITYFLLAFSTYSLSKTGLDQLDEIVRKFFSDVKTLLCFNNILLIK